MDLFDTPLEPSHLQRNSGDFVEVRRIAKSGSDYPVLMLNMNRYTRDSGFPGRGAYHEYIAGLGRFLMGWVLAPSCFGDFSSSAKRSVIRRSTRSSLADTRSIGTSWSSMTRRARLRISAARACASNMPLSIAAPAIRRHLAHDGFAILST